MPVELRKRKTPPQPAPSAPASKKASAGGGIKGKIAKAKEAVKEVIAKPTGKATPTENGAKAATVGSTVDLATFGGEVETHEGEKTTLAKLVEASKGGVVLFTYPKASTPGCTTQVCLFRDDYAPLTATGFSIFGLSTDSPKANTSFKTKQNLPYPLLCDPSATLISAIGLAKKPKGTTRGVFVVDKAGKVLASEPGGPAATVDVVRKLVGGQGGEAKEEPVSAPVAAATEPKSEELTKEPTKEEKAEANTAAEVADTAAKLDGEAEPKPAL